MEYWNNGKMVKKNLCIQIIAYGSIPDQVRDKL
jgi:hypothetical protein